MNFFDAAHWLRLRNMLKRAWDLMPFLGRLDYSNAVAWKRASLETALSILLSSIPLWVAVSALYWANLEPTLRSALSYIVRNGELLLLSGGAVSPLIYMTSVSYRARSKGRWVTTFPHGAWYMCAAVVIIVIVVTYITLRSTATHPLQAVSSLNTKGFDTLSATIYAVSVGIFFTASIHKNTLEADDPLALNKSEEEDFAKKWEGRPR